MSYTRLDARHGPWSAPLPAPGPVWFGAVMGTTMFPILLFVYFGPGLQTEHSAVAHALAVPSLVFWIATLLLCGFLTAHFLVRSAQERTVWRRSWGAGAEVLVWGQVAMGLLSLGVCSSLLVAAFFPSGLVPARLIMWVCLLVGAGLALVVPVVFARRVRAGRAGTPTFGWGGAVMPLVIASNSSAWLGVLHGHAVVSFALAMLSAAFFLCGVVSAAVIFVVGYAHHWWRTPLPLAAVPTAAVPLGLVGQCATASQMQAHNVEGFASVEAGRWMWAAASVQGVVLLPLGALAFAWALVKMFSGFRRAMPFTPAWWAPVYPLTSVAPGLLILGRLWDMPALGAAAWVFGALFVVSWILAAGGTVVALFVHRESWLGMFRMANLGPYLAERWTALRHPARTPDDRDRDRGPGDRETGVAEREVRLGDL